MDKLLEHGLSLLRQNRDGKFTQDAATAVEALQRVLIVASELEKEYRAALEGELKAMPKRARAIRQRQIRDVKHRATMAGMEAYQAVMLAGLRTRPNLKVV